jgi:HD-GYP domain-containing protein (c-di-GMP phosphodiesterase class II)
VALVGRDPDLAIFQVLRQHGNHHTQYGVNHSIHCAIAAFLAAHRLDWDVSSAQRAFKAALTMNLSMLELQGQLATQVAPLTPQQRESIHGHPQLSVQMLRVAGISDPLLLEAVAQHHETSDGAGYPAGLREVSPLAALLHRCDVYTDKLSPRRSREAMTADAAARGLFADHPGDAIAAAVIKEFGLYPPGSFVRLASGETGIVVRRGPSAHTPRVAVMTDVRGVPLSQPEPRDTSQLGYTIVAVLGSRVAHLHSSPEKLIAAVCI